MDVHVVCLNFSSSPTVPTLLKHKKFSLQSASHEHRSIDKIAQSYKQVSVPWAVPVVCRTQTSKFVGTCHLTATVMTHCLVLWKKNRDRFTEDEKVALMLNYFDVSPKYPYNWSKFCWSST